MKYGLGKIEVVFDIPKEVNEKEMYKYVQRIAEELAKSDVFKDCENPMLISEYKVSDEPFLNDKDYYEDEYGAIFPK